MLNVVQGGDNKRKNGAPKKRKFIEDVNGDGLVFSSIGVVLEVNNGGGGGEDV
jgi:hypothetical protein